MRQAAIAALVPVCGLAALSAGLWGLGRYLAWDLERSLRERSRLAAEIDRQRLAFDQLQKSTWGLRLVETDSGRFLVLPPGSHVVPGWTIEGRPAVQLQGD